MEPRLHATALVWREDGILIRGSSGSGKTTLAWAMVNEGRRAGVFSRFVADDVVLLRASSGRLVACPHKNTVGLAERRGFGIVPIAHEPACVVRIVIDFEVEPLARIPPREALAVSVLGITLPRLIVPRGVPALDNVYRTLDFIAAFRACS